MARRVLMVAVGTVLLAAASAGAAGAAQGSTAPAGPPVAVPPGSPATASVTGAPLNGVQLSMVAPKQLPMDLMTSASQPTPRELDVTVKDVGGGGYVGTASTVFTQESAAGTPGFTAFVQRFDSGSGSWKKLTMPSGTQAAFQDDVAVTVPAGGQLMERYRVDPGINKFDDLKIVTTANAATVTTVVPMTSPKFEVTGLPGSIRAGVPYAITGKLTNSTDTDYSGLDVEFGVGACDPAAGGGGCFLAKDSKLEIQSGGVWKPVQLQDQQQWSGFSGFPVKDATLAHGAVLSIPLRLTLPVNNLRVGAMSFMFQPNVTGGLGDLNGTLIAAPMPSAATRTPQASAPATPQASASATPQDSMSASASPSASATSSDTPSPTDSGSAATDGPTPSVSLNAASASSGSGSNPTVLLAFGLLVLCGGLVGGYFYLQRRGQA